MAGISTGRFSAAHNDLRFAAGELSGSGESATPNPPECNSIRTLALGGARRTGSGPVNRASAERTRGPGYNNFRRRLVWAE
jgi:hypothetical protein